MTLLEAPYLPIVIMMGIAAVFVATFLVLPRFLRPKKPDIAEDSVYECGIASPIDNARERFSVKFFLVAMLFILFDIETVFLYPWAILFRDFLGGPHGLFLLLEGLTFAGILSLGLAYIWKKGALNWR